MRRRLLVASLVLLGLAAATLEESFIHTDDGCVLETHCNACLLRIGSPGVVTEPLSLPQVVEAVGRVVSLPLPSLEDGTPRTASSRGPPPA